MLIASHNLNETFSLIVNAGIDYNGTSAVPTWINVISLGASLSEKWGVNN
jgi:hypothetical protein